METGYFLVADKRFYESIDLYRIEAGDYLDIVSGIIDGDWEILRKGVWIHCHNRKSALPVQGWKIHVSSIPQDAKRLLHVVATYLVQSEISFKFLADARMLRMASSKSWTRGGAGKFITIYPADTGCFKLLLAELEPLTREFCGPYILSDRRYKDSKVLYYRYGGIMPNSRLQPDGRLTPVLVASDGRESEDVRHPTYRLPDWVEEPFPDMKDSYEGLTLNNGRYVVEKAIQFSNTGGVYIAHDAVSRKQVVLKEARAHVHNFSEDADAADMLRNEYFLLKKIEECGVAPRPIELFQEWEHLFLAEEYFEGYVPLRKYSAQGCLFLDTRPTQEKVERYLKRDLGIIQKLALILDALHAQGIVWGDISFNNVLVHPKTLDVKIIDLESAQVMGSEKPQRIITPGFADPKRPSEVPPTVEDDYYGVGALLLFLLTHVNGLLELKPRAWEKILSEMALDFGLPPEIPQAVASLLSEDISRRPRPSALLEQAQASLGKIGPIRFNSEAYEASFPRSHISAAIQEACRFVKANADLHRKDRLFPADPLVFQTNPLSLAHGAVGVLYVLHQVERSVEPAMLEWLLKAETSAASYPPGLYLGLAGIAWGLLEMGQVSEAQATLEKSFNHPILGSSSDIYYGMAGWGLTNLRFWLKTGERSYLDNAEAAGRALLETAQNREGRLCWPTKEGVTHYGLCYGASGIGLFLLYLDRALGGGAYEDEAIRAFDYDLAQAVEVEGERLSWPRNDKNKDIITPYWKAGSAGIGIVALRYLRALKQPRYRELVERIHMDCDRKYAIFPGRNDGLAGIGEFLLDAYLETGDPKYLNSAYKIASGLKIFCIQQEEGVAFPGNGLSRLSCDLATGSSGIVLFLDRLLHSRLSDFLLDEVLQ